MAPSTLSFNTALVTGGAGGIGYALAKYLISIDKKVIIVGRTESKLEEAVKKLGHGTTYYVLDTGDVPSIAGFVSKVTQEHPDVDCLINNAGVQRPLDVNNFDLSKADEEIDINIRGPLHLAIGLLPHFKRKEAAVIINVSSVLGFSPFSIINPVYNGTKAWLHFWTMNLRTQLAQSADSRRIRVVEIVPPTVSTDLHRDRADPDDNKKEKNPDALSVEEFMARVREGLQDGRDTITAGIGEELVGKWYDAFGEKYEEAAKK